ncbi:MAG: DUF421 domain-containing protein [Planctomycetota bacterium]|nr:MAG: DUF421 domain-containing protein [Planctomycetota bacterium]
MHTVLNAAILYMLLLVVFRMAGRRVLAKITTFDLVLLLVVSEATQQAFLGTEDASLTTAALAILTLVALDVALAQVKQRLPRLESWLDGTPLVIVEDGRPLRDRMARARVGVDDVMAAARALQGLERMEQIRYAVLERNGEITVIPRSPR